MKFIFFAIFFIYGTLSIAKENVSYAIKMGSFNSFKGAKKIKNIFLAKNIDIDKEDFLYKVSIKNITSREHAEKILKKIKPIVPDAYIKEYVQSSSVQPIVHVSKPTIDKSDETSFDIKIGNFTSLNNAKKIFTRFPNYNLRIDQEGTLYKVLIQDVNTRKQADALLVHVRDKVPDAYIVPRSSSHAIYKANIPSTTVVNIAQKEILSYWSLLSQYCTSSASVLLKWYELKELYSELGIQASENFPTVTLNYMLQYQKNILPENLESSSYDESESTWSNKNVSLNIQQNLYHFGETGVKNDIAEIDIEMKKEEINLEIETLAMNILEYYTIALQEQTKMDYAQKLLQTQKHMLKITKLLINSGVLSQEDLLNQQQGILTYKKRIHQAFLLKTDALEDLFIIINKSYNQKDYMLDTLRVAHRPLLKFEETTLSKLLYHKIEKGKKLVDLRKKSFFPSIDYTGTYNLHGIDVNKYKGENEWSLGLFAKWELFNGMKDFYTVEKSDIAVEKEEKNYLLEKSKYQSELIKNRNSIQNHTKNLSTVAHILENDLLKKKRLIALQKAGRVNFLELDKAKIEELQHGLEFSLLMIDVKKSQIINSLKANLWEGRGKK